MQLIIDALPRSSTASVRQRPAGLVGAPIPAPSSGYRRLNPGEVDVYVELVAEHLAVLDGILALTREIECHTIEQVMAKNDLELGLEALLGPGYLRPGPD